MKVEGHVFVIEKRSKFPTWLMVMYDIRLSQSMILLL